MFSRGEFITFIETIFGEPRITNNGREANVVCPMCKEKKGRQYTKQKLALRTDGTNLVKCWVCGYKSRNLIYLLKRFHPYFLDEYLKKFVDGSILMDDNEQEEWLEEKIELPKGFKLLAVTKEQQYIDYLNTRFDGEITEQDLWYWKFGYTNEDRAYDKRVLILSHDGSGELNYYTGRTIDSRNLLPYLNPNIPRENVIFNEINIDWLAPLVIVEGVFDLIKCPTNATCLLGSELTEEYDLFAAILKNNTPVILALDPDANKKSLTIASLLHEYSINVKILNIPEPYKDIGEMSKNDFTSLLNDAIPYNREYSIRSKIANII